MNIWSKYSAVPGDPREKRLDSEGLRGLNSGREPFLRIRVQSDDCEVVRVQ